MRPMRRRWTRSASTTGPAFFLEDGRYTVQARENFDRGLPLALIALESRGMMKDRVYGVTQTIYHRPYYTRHVVGPARMLAAQEGDAGGLVRAQANYAVFRTRPGDASEVYNVGRYIDEPTKPPATAPTPVPICAFVGLVLQPPRPMSAAAAAVDKISFVFMLFTFAKSFRLLLLTFTL
jgi:hypothetical protein